MRITDPVAESAKATRDALIDRHGERAVVAIESYFRRPPLPADAVEMFDLGPALHLIQWITAAGVRLDGGPHAGSSPTGRPGGPARPAQRRPGGPPLP